MLKRRVLIGFELLDAEGAAGGSGVTAADFDELCKTMQGVADSHTEIQDKIKATHEKVESIKGDNAADVAKVAAELVTIKNQLAYGKAALGPSGAEDFLNEINKFVCGAYHHKAGAKQPEWTKLANDVSFDELMEKAAIDMTTTTSATAGYLVPDYLHPGIVELKDLYGPLYPRLTKVNVPAGHSLKISTDAVAPVANWQSAQGADMGIEGTPMSFGRETLITELCGSYIAIANELYNSPGTNFGGVATIRMLRAIIKSVETHVLAGVASTSGPSNGVITDATDQGNIASVTLALIIGFIQACGADNDYAFDTTSNALFMHPNDILTLAGQAVGASELTGMLIWGDPRTGAPSRLLGYELISHPAMNDGTTNMIALGEPGSILLAEDPSFSIDVNPLLEKAYIANETWLRVFNHFDWSIGQSAQWHQTSIGA